MNLLNQNWISFSGEPVTGRVPAQIRLMNDNPLTGEQRADVARAYWTLASAVNVSPASFLVQESEMPDGTRIRVVTNNGNDIVQVWPAFSTPKSENKELAGIGLRLTGWNNDTAPQLSGYWLISYMPAKPATPEKWVAKNYPALIGGEKLWVNAGRTKWLTTNPDGGVYTHNTHVTSGVLPFWSAYPEAFLSKKRGTSLSGVSILSMEGGTAKLYQRDVDSMLFEEKDSLDILPYAWNMKILGIDGDYAVATTEVSAYKILLSPILTLASTTSLPQPSEATFSSTGEMSYAGRKNYTSTSVVDGVTRLPSDWSNPPDRGSVPQMLESHYSGDSPPNLLWTIGPDPYTAPDDISANISYGHSTEYSDNFRIMTDTWTDGFWGFQAPVDNIIATTSTGSTSGNLTESFSSHEDSNSPIAIGARHNGDVWHISHAMSISNSFSGNTIFNNASSTATKNASREVTETWTLPNGSISTGCTYTESFSDVSIVSCPEFFVVSGVVQVTAGVSKEKLYFQYYDPDMDCTVFIKEVITADGVITWEKNNEYTYEIARTPVGSYAYGVGDVNGEIAGSATFSVCAYLGGALAYESVLATVPATGGCSQFVPVLSDVKLEVTPGGVDQNGEAWPAPTQTRGSGAIHSVVTYEPKLVYGEDMSKTWKYRDASQDMPGSTPEWITLGIETLYVVQAPGQLLLNEHNINDIRGVLNADGSGGYLPSPYVFMFATVSQQSSDVVIREDASRTVLLDGERSYTVQADAAGEFNFESRQNNGDEGQVSNMGNVAKAAKDVATGALAIEVKYSSSEFPSDSQNRSCILLVSPGKVIPLSDLIKPVSVGEFSTDYKSDDFLATI